MGRVMAALVALLVTGGAPARAAADPDLVTKGEYLSRAGDCVSCHTAPGGQPFAGGLKMATPFGDLVTPNITPDDETGIGAWSADDLWRAMHEGVNKAGKDLYPVMPYTFYTKVTRDDVNAIYAYLRSLKPVRNAVTVDELRFPFDIRLTQLFWRELYFTPGVFQPDPAKSAAWNRGAYLVEGLGHCGACHSPRNALGAIEKDRAMTGARIDHWFALNLTGDLRRGLGRWSEAQVAAFLRKGAAKGKATALGPMHEVVHNSLRYLTDADIMAMAVYLKSLPPRGRDAPSAGIAMPLPSRAARLYLDNCGACHQAKGVGIPGAVPPLAGNPVVLAPDPSDILSVVLAGVPGRGSYMAMPSSASTLKDADIAEIANYVRTSWGNTASTLVSAGTVAAIRTAAAAPSPPAPPTAPSVTEVAAAPAPPARPGGAQAATPAPAAVPPAGWFTAADAKAGDAVFEQNCVMCHGGKLQGGVGPALAGEAFKARWAGKTLGDLVRFEHKQMPMGSPGSLTAEQYAQVTSYILQQNGYVAGSVPLSVATDGARPLAR
jgi:mono/diheme cytochrome c family protein